MKITVGDYTNAKFETELVEHEKVRFQLDEKIWMDVSVDGESGELEIYTNEGQLLSYSKSLNLMRVRREPHWGDVTTIRLVAHTITRMQNTGQKGPVKLAEAAFNIIRGRSS